MLVFKTFCLYLYKSNASAYTPNGRAKYSDICLKFIDKTIAIVARAILPSKINAIAHSTKPCIT